MTQPSPRSGAAADYDVLIVGGGPAGTACAAVCAGAGLSVLVVERAFFPRDKVCGDCLNPDAWPTLERLGAASAVRALPHVLLEAVEFRGLDGHPVRLPLPSHGLGEIAVRRSVFDACLLDNARARGASVRQGTVVSGVQRVSNGFEATLTASNPVGTVGGTRAPAEVLTARFLVAADGRNSVAARLTGLLEERRHPARDRIGFQAHVPCPAGFGPKVQMRWFAQGYGGLCPVGEGLLNVSLVGPPASLGGLKKWAREEFGLDENYPWRTIAPLDRAPALRSAEAVGVGAVFLVGDAARVVEPFTGEGIYYALRTGELAADAIVAAGRGGAGANEAVARYRASHAVTYRGRLWVNRLARWAGRHPRAASQVLRVARWQPGLLGLLTSKVVG